MKKFLVASIVLALFFGSCGSRRNTSLGTSKSTNSTTSAKPSGTSTSGLSYIEQYKDIAIEEMNMYGIPASIKLAQAILESGNGNSYLARSANNHFGIKCGGVWTGKSVTKDDDNRNDCFRVYQKAEESFRDHSQFLLRKRYEKLFTLAKDDYKGWARGLKDAGYATNPRYPQLLIDLIERYNLQQYDRQEAPTQVIARAHQVEEIIEEKQEMIADEPIAQEVQEIKQPVAMVIHEVKATETLAGIAKKYNIAIADIKALNGLSSESISVGELLVVSK